MDAHLTRISSRFAAVAALAIALAFALQGALALAFPHETAYAGDTDLSAAPLILEQSEGQDLAPQSIVVPQATLNTSASISYRTHVQNVGWQGWASNGTMAGTQGRSLRLEAIEINVSHPGLTGSIHYQTHVQNVGWQNPVANGKTSGTSGRSLRLEGIKIWLDGQLAQYYDVYYRTHIQNVGWQGWKKNGALSGTTGRSLRLEGIEIVLSPKGSAAPASGGTPSVRYVGHVQNDGWHPWVSDGALCGTTGRSLRIEGFKATLNTGSTTGGIEYEAHVQNVGWQKPASNGGMAGTSGRSLRIEALRIRLTGAIASSYDVYYRVHIQNYGWLDWAKNGAQAGSTGMSLRLEALQIRLVPKGGAAPGKTTMPSLSSRWQALESQYIGNPRVNNLIFVKYRGGTSADVEVKTKSGGAWKTSLTCAGYVGRGGIGTAREGIPVTPEGDFGITGAFGINGNPGAKLPYTKVTSSMYLCADRAYYNQLIDINTHWHWCSGEHLIDCVPYYNYGLFMDYNTNPTVYGAGSAFFLHCKGSPNSTDGCIAVNQSSMIQILRIVGPGTRICIYPK